MKHSKKVLTASIALLLGVSGAAFGNLLENPGFEVADGDALNALDWTQDAGAERSGATGYAGGTPAWSMFMSGDGEAVYEGSAYQEVGGLDECSPYGLATFEANGFYDNSGLAGSVAGMTVAFNVGTPFEMASDGDNGGYEEMTVLGNIPAWAVSAIVTVDGMHPTPSTEPSVHWDDIDFSTDCVADYAKVSGKASDSNRPGKGKNSDGWNPRGAYSFSGAIGTLESEACEGAAPVGMLHINYKNAGFSCDFTPTAPVDYGEGTATLAVSYLCEIADGDDLEGIAVIQLTQGTGLPKGKNKDRGMISVTNDDLEDEDGINIDADDEDPEANPFSLTKGNVNLMPADCS
ncbi:hypothetical protein Ssed_3277 [Shewanella sediminis HAW-EB3]|uniref:Uncharacterized protein n=1 Tax=Shewanella sediminis (strain HAW-EB3) TaxID=425104 RepID=A8FYF8_SHESH|nr:hypothetical protein [Shewanella sediminis]ABV37881.1 hypothetical protein Ssed_3277 [Shewanella sediminis HAW-EB3]